MSQKISLADFVRQVMNEKKLSAHEVARRSGGEITHAYINGIKNGTSTNLSANKIIALSKGLGVHEDEIFRVSRGVTETPDSKDEEVQMLFRGYRELSQQDKDELKATLKMVIADVERRLSKKR